MFRRLALGALISMVATGAHAENGSGYAYPIGLDPNGDNFLALRNMPTAREGYRIRKLGPGTLFKVVEQRGAWYNVRLLDGETGWVFGRFVGCCAPGPNIVSSSPVAAAQASQTTQVIVQSSAPETERLRGEIQQLSGMVRANQERQEKRERDEAAARQSMAAKSAASEVSVVDENKLEEIGERLERAVSNRASYLTPTKPDDQDLGATARAASEQFPRVPYYIPGTSENGRFWVEPRVDDTGSLIYSMIFVDPRANVDQKRGAIDLTPEQLKRIQIAVAKLPQWSEVAHRNEVRRSYRKRVDCLPDASCPRDGDKIEGKSSTEVIFIVNDDGSTGGRIQRNKGRYDEGYNISIKSAKLLASYLKYVESRGQRDYAAGTRTSADIDEMFK